MLEVVAVIVVFQIGETSGARGGVELGLPEGSPALLAEGVGLAST